MYLQHFGLTHAPLGKELTEPWDDGALGQLAQRFDWLLKSPGIGLLTGEPGVGKTAALRKLTRGLNPHRYLVLYQAETDFGRVDLYRGLARALGLEPAHRRAQLWRDIKQRVHELADAKQVTPIWIIDEAQNLPAEFFRDFATRHPPPRARPQPRCRNARGRDAGRFQHRGSSRDRTGRDITTRDDPGPASVALTLCTRRARRASRRCCSSPSPSRIELGMPTVIRAPTSISRAWNE